MKKSIFTIVILLVLASFAWAGPFLVCDPQVGVTYYSLTGPNWVPATTPAQTDGSLKLDLATATVGTSDMTVKACNTLWGCSSSVPFQLVRPPIVSNPQNIKLTP